MNILMIGASGYLGSNLSYKLSKDGHRLFCVYRNKSALEKLGGINVDYIASDLTHIEDALKKNDIDTVINCACQYKSDEKTLYGNMVRSNLFFPFDVLNLSIKYKVSRFVTAGTCLPDNTDFYSYSKRQLTGFGKFLSEKGDISFVEFRLEMFYGGNNEPDNRFMKSSITKMIKNEALDLTEGTQKRDIIHMDDVMTVFSETLKNESYLTGFKILPVGSGKQYSMRKMLCHMRNYLGSQSLLNFGSIQSRKNEPDTMADTSWYRDLDFKLKYSGLDGLDEECRKTKSLMCDF